MKINHKEHNIRLITVDSCRYDTAQKAFTPNIDQVGKLRKAETSGSYTYPAHQSFFLGDLPRILDGSREYLPGINQIWRSLGARKLTGNKSILLPFDAKNIIEYYQQIGHNVQGFGGVGFFNTHNPNNTLPSLFDNFMFFGGAANLAPSEKMPRSPESLPFGNIDTILERTQREPYFLFVNSPTTHIPYDIPTTNVDDEYKDLIIRTFDEHGKKKKYSQETLPFTTEEILYLKMLQVAALEWVDQQIGELFSQLPLSYPTITIICGDHGEEFGDNGRFGHAHPDETVMTVPVWSGLTE